MKLSPSTSRAGFTLTEILISVTIGLVLTAVLLSASIGLQKSFNAADHFFSTHVQQIRIIDYLSRDVKRAHIVFASSDQQTISCLIPNLISGTTNRVVPVVLLTNSGPRVDYGRMVTGALTKNSTTFTAATAGTFTAADVGSVVAGFGIPDPSPSPGQTPVPTKIVSVTSGTVVTLSNAATATTSTDPISVSPMSTVVYTVNNATIVRTENNAVTTIAASTDQLIAKGTDITDDLRNTEYLDSNVTFLPVFNFNPAPDPSATPDALTQAKRNGTAVYAKSYLRNKRRG